MDQELLNQDDIVASILEEEFLTTEEKEELIGNDPALEILNQPCVNEIVIESTGSTDNPDYALCNDTKNCCGMHEKEITYVEHEEDKCVLLTNGNKPLTLSCSGRFLTLAVKLRTCPRKKLNIGIVLYDVQTNEALGYEVQQFCTGDQACAEGTVFGPFRFVFPDPSGILPKRMIKVCVVAHYCDLY